MTVLDAVGRGLAGGLDMAWETLWALVAGFVLSGAVQAFVARRDMQRVLGTHRPEALLRAGLLGVASSSCSYAASALARTLFRRGADFTAAMVFMVASTNLVVELGIVLWLLLGWQFALAEFVGGTIMIVGLGIALPRIVPERLLVAARATDATEQSDAAHRDDDLEPLRSRLRSRADWQDAAGFSLGDLRMLRTELVAGFLVAGMLGALVPDAAWRALFLTGHGFWPSVENVVLGPFLAVISFVCSVGNLPLAAALWKGGISFGGVLSFVFADLITLPLLVIYRRYYGTRVTMRLVGVFWAVMSTAGLATQYLFRAASIPLPARPHHLGTGGLPISVTTTLDVLALAAVVALVWVRRTPAGEGSSRFGVDPVCGMHVEVAHAAAEVRHDGARYVFCSDGCRDTFVTDPVRYAARMGPAAAVPSAAVPSPGGRTLLSVVDESLGVGRGLPADAADVAAAPVDPVCGMTVDRARAGAPVTYEGTDYVFCATGCRDAFVTDPAHWLATSPTGMHPH